MYVNNLSKVVLNSAAARTEFRDLQSQVQRPNHYAIVRSRVRVSPDALLSIYGPAQISRSRTPASVTKHQIKHRVWKHFVDTERFW